jgi:hypothetical protein
MLKDKIIESLAEHFEAHIKKHAMNIQIMLETPLGIPEHTDYMDSIEKELALIAEYKDKLEALETVQDLM